MINIEKLEVQLEFLRRNGESVQSLVAFLGDREPSLMQIAGFAKALETTYNFLEGALKEFAIAEGRTFQGDNSHRELLDWALSHHVDSAPLLPTEIPFRDWLAFRHKMKYQSLDLIYWRMISSHVRALPDWVRIIEDHFRSVATTLTAQSEATNE